MRVHAVAWRLSCARMQKRTVVDAEVDVISILVRHDIGCDNESPSSKRSRQRANWDAEERAVRAADTRAAADHRLRERSRKALKREADAVVQY